MPRSLFFPLIVLALAIGACSHGSGVAPDGPGGLATVKYGTYFGKCSGYCSVDMTVDPAAVVLVRSSWNSTKFPDAETRRATVTSEWADLQAIADVGAMAALDSVIGCPDCADGGGEWVEVHRGDNVKRVVFEYGATIPAIKDLVARLRSIRATFKD